jgi:CspA family cold shock protein
VIGVIKTLNFERGFGFITGQDGVDYFFHKSALSDSQLFDELHKGDDIELVEIANTDKGWRANSIVPLATA